MSPVCEGKALQQLCLHRVLYSVQGVVYGTCPQPESVTYLHAGTFLCVGFSLPPCGVCLLCGCRWFIL